MKILLYQFLQYLLQRKTTHNINFAHSQVLPPPNALKTLSIIVFGTSLYKHIIPKGNDMTMTKNTTKDPTEKS